MGSVQTWWEHTRPPAGTFGASVTAGLPGAVAGIPDGMASATLVGVNPIHGLYASMIGRIAGGLTASTSRMVVTTTGAAALAAGSALSGVPADERLGALFVLTIVAGVAMLVAGALGLGRFTGFVSHSVMTGFLTGVAVNIVLGQLQDLLGVDASGDTSLARAADVVLHPGRVHIASLVVGVAAIVVLTGLRGTRMASVSALVALVVTALGVAVTGTDAVHLVRDVGDIPRGLPLPVVPRPGLLSVDLVLGAVAVAVIVLVQGAGVAETAPDPGGRRSDADRDFLAQGAANVAAGFLRGMPVGGSVGQTSVNLGAGARDRWAAVCSGGWILLVLVALGGLVGRVPIPTLAAVLVVASIAGIRIAELGTIWRTGPQSQVAMATTFVATLLLPVAAAVGIGVAISLLLQVNQESTDLRVVELVEQPDGTHVERDVPAVLPDREVTLLDVYGSLSHAGARTLEAALPDPTTSASPVVVLRLRGRTRLGATAFTVLAGYADRIGGSGGRLFVSGVEPDLVAQFARVVGDDADHPIGVFEASPILGRSTRTATRDARTWLVQTHPDLVVASVDEHGPSPATRVWRWLRTTIGRPGRGIRPPRGAS